MLTGPAGAVDRRACSRLSKLTAALPTSVSKKRCRVSSACPCSSGLFTSTRALGSTLSLTAGPAVAWRARSSSMVQHSSRASPVMARSASLSRGERSSMMDA